MLDLSKNTRHFILALGICQGILLLLAWLLVDFEIFSAPADMMWLLPWYAVAIGVPTALQLIVNQPSDRRLWWFGLGLSGIFLFTGMYVGYSVEPTPTISSFPVVMPYVLTMLIGWYVLLPFVQAWLKTEKWRPAYTDLFEFAWNNIITLKIAAIFTGIFWVLLALWAGLFNVIGIAFFTDLFYSAYFAYPVSALVFAFALYLGRNHASAVITVRRVILAIFWGLLPLLSVIVLLFIAALPFMGLKPLWDTGRATVLMLLLQIFFIIFLNAVFQNGKVSSTYNNWLRTLVRTAVVVLPIYTILCFYALYLRIDQHGWTPWRFWALLLIVIVGLHVVGYAASALRRKSNWMNGIAPVNIGIAAVVVVIAVAVNSPILDVRRISAGNQVARLLDGTVSANKFDYAHLRFDLGRPGNAALAQLKQIEDHPEAATIRESARHALLQNNRWLISRLMIGSAEEAIKHFSVYPQGERLADSFLQYALSERGDWRLKRCLEVSQRCAILIIDLNRDKRNDYILFRAISRWDRMISIFEQSDTSWTHAGNLHMRYSDNLDSLEKIEAMLSKGNYSIVANAWNNLKVGDETLRFTFEN